MMNQGGDGGMNPMMMMQLLGGDSDCKPSSTIDKIDGASDDDKEAIAKGDKFYNGNAVVDELKDVSKATLDKAAAYFDYDYAKCKAGGSGGMDSMLPLLMGGGMGDMNPMMMMMLMGGDIDPMMMMLMGGMGGNAGGMDPMMMMMLMGGLGDESKEDCMKKTNLEFAFKVVEGVDANGDAAYTVSKVTSSSDIQAVIEGKAYSLPEGAAADLLKCLENASGDKSDDSFSKMLPFLMMMNQPKPVITQDGQTIVQSKPAMDPFMMMMLMKGM